MYIFVLKSIPNNSNQNVLLENKCQIDNNRIPPTTLIICNCPQVNEIGNLWTIITVVGS